MASVTKLGQQQPIIKPKPTLETRLWQFMRISGVLLIPLAWGHVLIQDVLVGVNDINFDYVAMRWGTLGWRVYDILLLAFAFAHGMNGLRQVTDDYIHRESLRRAVSWVIIIAWAVITAIGAMAIIAFTGSKVGPLG